MIREVTMYAAVCDDCNTTVFDKHGSDYYAWSDKSGAMAEADGSDWVNPDGDTLYCPDCAGKRAEAEEAAEELREVNGE